MSVAAPGVGKSLLATNWAALSGAKTLYVSPDTDARTMTESLAALATGHSRDVVKRRLHKEPAWRQVYQESIHSSFPNLVMDFTSGPDIASVLSKAEALTEVFGVTPELIVLDTASDLRKPNEDFSAWRDLWLNIRELARYLNCVCYVAHHVKNGLAANGTVPPLQSDGQYKADQFAEIVIGLHRDGEQLVSTVLKNRGGKSQVPIRLNCDYTHGAITE